MTLKKRWFALLGPALAATVAVAASAQPKGAPSHSEAGKKHAGPGMPPGPGGPPPAVGRAPDAKDKENKGAVPAANKGKDKPGDKDKENKGAVPAANKGKDKPGDKGRDEVGANTEVPPPPAGAPDETLRNPPNHRAGHRVAPNAKLRQKWQERRGDQMKRRRARLQELRERWGEEELTKPAVKAAIKVHAWRMARLKRIRELAEQDPDGKDFVEKADKLTEKEQERFRLQMNRLKTGSDVGVIGDGGTIAPFPTAKGQEPASTAGQKEGAAAADKPSTAGQKEGAK